LKKIINKFVFDKMLMLVAGGKKVRIGREIWGENERKRDGERERD